MVTKIRVDNDYTIDRISLAEAIAENYLDNIALVHLNYRATLLEACRTILDIGFSC